MTNNFYDDATQGSWKLDGAGWNVMSSTITGNTSDISDLQAEITGDFEIENGSVLRFLSVSELDSGTIELYEPDGFDNYLLTNVPLNIATYMSTPVVSATDSLGIYNMISFYKDDYSIGMQAQYDETLSTPTLNFGQKVAQADNEILDVSTGLKKDVDDTTTGKITAAGFDASSNAITSVEDPTNNQDAATKAYVDSNDSDTTYTAGTNLTLSGTEFNVDDAFIKNDADDTSTGKITAADFAVTNDNATNDSEYVPMVLHGTDATPPTASNYPQGTIYIQYTT